MHIIVLAVERGAERNALGRSRGGYSTKINAPTTPMACQSDSSSRKGKLTI
jgi:hypothetical protein